MKLFLLAIAFSAIAYGQTATLPPLSPFANLPGYVTGVGPSWTRGGASRFSSDVTVGIRIGQGQWYSWTNISTADKRPAPGAGPVVSTLTTGGAWIPVQTAGGGISLIFIVQAGFSNLQATSTLSPSFSGTMAIAFRIGKSHWYVMPYAKTLSATATTAATAATAVPASAVFQPGLQVLYGFGK